jgi:hypothetical protein
LSAAEIELLLQFRGDGTLTKLFLRPFYFIREILSVPEGVSMGGAILLNVLKEEFRFSGEGSGGSKLRSEFVLRKLLLMRTARQHESNRE